MEQPAVHGGDNQMTRLGTLSAVLLIGLLASCAEQSPPVEPAKPAPSAAETIYVFVQRGQTLKQIAHTYGVAPQDIIAANNLKPPYNLKPGTALAIQFPAETEQKAKPPAKPRGAAVSAHPPKHKEPEVIPLD